MASDPARIIRTPPEWEQSNGNIHSVAVNLKPPNLAFESEIVYTVPILFKETSNLKAVDVFTDGSCILHDNGRGGYGALLIYGSNTKELYGGFTLTTNNRMELLAVIYALEELKYPCAVTIYSDSRYVTEPVNKNWIQNWVKKDFNGIKNPDLWRRLLPLLDKHDVTFVWVKGHSGVPNNERADELASIGASLPNLPIDKRLDKG